MVVAVLLLMGCAPAPVQLDWQFSFGDQADLENRVTVVDVELRLGGCDGEPVYEASIDRATVMPEPVPELGPGVVGIVGRAIDRNCVAFATACELVTLPPTVRNIIVTLEAADEEPLCGAATCNLGRCSDAGPDAGSVTDGGTAD